MEIEMTYQGVKLIVLRREVEGKGLVKYRYL